MYQMLLAERKNEPLSLHPLSILQSCCACRRPCCGAVVRACWALVRCKRRSARCARCITSSLGRPTRQALCLRPRRPLQARPGGALPAAGPASGGALLDARRWQRVRDAAALRAPLAAYATEVWEQALADSPAVRAQLSRAHAHGLPARLQRSLLRVAARAAGSQSSPGARLARVPQCGPAPGARRSAHQQGAPRPAAWLACREPPAASRCVRNRAARGRPS